MIIRDREVACLAPDLTTATLYCDTVSVNAGSGQSLFIIVHLSVFIDKIQPIDTFDLGAG